MRRLIAIPLIVSVLGACAKAPPPETDWADGRGEPSSLFPPQASEDGAGVEITARVTFDLPRYRVRGACSIYRSPAGSVQIDFIHSSLFGSYREDATVFIEPGSISIQDNERGIYRGEEETLAHLQSRFEFDIMPFDVLVFMLLGAPGLDDIERHVSSFSGSGWKIEGEWNGRKLEMEGEDGLGPVRIRLCSKQGKGCYEARYRYGSSGGLLGYPEKIVCRRVSGSERISMTVESVSRE